MAKVGAQRRGEGVLLSGQKDAQQKHSEPEDEEEGDEGEDRKMEEARMRSEEVAGVLGLVRHLLVRNVDRMRKVD